MIYLEKWNELGQLLNNKTKILINCSSNLTKFSLIASKSLFVQLDMLKKMLTSEDSLHILKAFVNDLLETDFKELQPKQTYHIDSYISNYEKAQKKPKIQYTEVDILATTEDGTQTTIECQIQPHDHFNSRALFYLIEAFRSSLGKKKSKNIIKDNLFSSLHPAYGINIIDFHLADAQGNALRRFRLLDEKTQQPFLGAQEEELLILCFLSLKSKNIQPNSAVHHWQTFLKTGEVATGAPEYIKEAKNRIDFYNLGREEQKMIMKIDKAEAISNAVMSTKLNQGRREGLELGIIKVSRSMLKDNLPLEMISKYTGLSIEKLEELKREQEQ